MNTNTQTAVGYLPDERPTFIKLLLYAIQQVIVMFPATVTVALITGFQVSTTIFASGLATVCFILITGRKIPMYYGSSFAYLTAISSMVAAEGTAEQIASFEATGILPTELISYAQFGIMLSGLVSIAAGLLVRFCGHKAVERILPASITGPVAMIIGLTLAGNALSDAAPQAVEGVSGSSWVWVISLITLLSTILFSRYLKGVLGQLPLLLGRAGAEPVPADACRGAGRFRLEAWRRLAVRPAGLFPAKGILAGCGGYHAHRHRYDPGVHGPYLPA